jgi:hypothetical protein
MHARDQTDLNGALSMAYMFMLKHTTSVEGY